MSDQDESKHESQKSPVSARRAKKMRHLTEYLLKQESRNNSKKVSRILKKSEHERTETEREHLAKHADIVKRIRKNKERRQISAQRTQELEDSEDLLQRKCEELARILRKSKKTVIYTGAGISTAASIPDYRGPQGVWTLLKKGEQIDPQDLSDAEPTLTHMCITQLHSAGHVKHVVSQNCDGLHLRSGLPRPILSEVHGNMFIEICYKCRPNREYVRLFDVTENTGVRRHATGRKCHKCRGELRDTIVHFGEKGGMKSPYHWREAVKAANKCDLILCLGSSLKILKKYACLWCMDRAKHKRPKLVIVNLQWTPKDESATIKINGRCDDVMQRVMTCLGYTVPQYSRQEDPLFSMATSHFDKELETISKKILERPDAVDSKFKHGISRSPTPSDSDSETASEDSSDTETEEKNEMTSDTDRIQIKASLENSKDVRSVAHTAVQEHKNSIQKFMTKSERICNEAKLAMQTKLVNAKINEVYSDCEKTKTGTAADQFLELNCTADDKVKIEQLHDTLYDPLKAGPFDPGPESYSSKLAYLHSLQAQLEQLKEKQKALKHQEVLEQKMKRHISYSGNCEIKTEQKLSVQDADFCHLKQGKCTNELQISICDIKAVETELANCRKHIEKLQHEKDELEKRKSRLLTETAEQEHQIQKRDQNDQLRLHQHFLIKEQLLAQAGDGQGKKDDLFKLFVYQRQLLIAQQNAQLQDLKQKHTLEMQDIAGAIKKKSNEIQSENNKLVDFQRKLSSVQMGSPTKTDHSIMSILKHEEGKQSGNVINSQSGVVAKSATCDSCRFLKDYGISKRKCQTCQILRAKNGLALRTTLVKTSPPATETYSSNLNDVVEKLSMRCTSQRVCDLNTNNFKCQGTVDSSADSLVPKLSTPHTVSTSLKMDNSSQGLAKQETSPSSNIPLRTVQAHVDVQESNSANSSNSQGEGVSIKLIDEKNTTCLTETYIKIDGTISSASQRSKDIVKVYLPESEDDNNDKVEVGSDIKPLTEEDRMSAVKPAVCQKPPVRSHSQSELYGNKSNVEESVTAGSRYVRSHSHSEGTSRTSSDLELTPTKSDDGLESSVEGSSSGRKRKNVKGLSVPGWFGKGLNIKKKRR